MSQTLRFLLLVLALVAVSAAALQFLRDRSDGQMAPTETELWGSLPYKTESQWIVSQVARAVVDMGHFSAQGAPLEPAQLELRSVTQRSGTPLELTLPIGGREHTIRIETWVWDPAAYVALARAAGVVPGDAAARSEHDGLIRALADLRAETLVEANRTVSAALEKDFRNPAHHEAAALLLGSLAFREAAGSFYDPRTSINRATAHLAVAQALRNGAPSTTLVGRLAAGLLQVVGGRPGPAVPMLDALERDTDVPAAHAWIRALRRRATLDWRVPAGDEAPLVERLEYTRSLARMLTPNASLEYLESRQPEPLPDWGWRSLDFSLTVANGHTFVGPTLIQTYAEADAVLHIWPDGNQRVALTGALSAEPAASSISRDGTRRVDVLDRGTWSAFYRRHLAHAASRGSDFYRDMLGSKPAAVAFEAEIDARQKDLATHPIVHRLRARDADEYKAAMTRLIPLLRERPMLMPYTGWGVSVKRAPKNTPMMAAPQPDAWFAPIFPYGTAFDASRMNVHTIITDDFMARADEYHRLSPWEPLITINRAAIHCRNQCAPEEEHGYYTLIADYHLWSMRRFAYKAADPVASLTRVCEVNVDDCHLLADWFVGRDRFPEAVEAWEHYIANGRDRVRISNRVEWLARHYQATGRLSDARRVAELAADVGSGDGMRTLAGVLERSGHVEEAAEIYRRMLERYDDGRDLLAFHLRREAATGRKAAGPEYVTLMQRYFDGALERMDPASLKPRPTRGLVVKSTSWWNEKAGLKRGDIIVAMGGYRVTNRDQYVVLYEQSFDAPLRLKIWRHDSYVDVEGLWRGYYYSIDVDIYAVPGGN